MNRYTFRMLLRSIRASLGRYLAILAIVALGVGFFAGLKSSYPAMLTTADRYLRQQHFHDYRLLSTLGFTDGDVDAFEALDGVALAEGGYFTDAWMERGGQRLAVAVFSLPGKVDLPVLTAGRMPETAGECLADSRAFGEADLGAVLRLCADNEEEVRELLPAGEYTVVGLARSPRFLSENRGDTTLGSGTLSAFVLLPAAAFDAEAWHELRLWCDAPGELYSETYNGAHARMDPRVESFLNRRGNLRHAELRAEADKELLDARKELDDGWEEYRDAKADAEKEFDDAEKKLSLALFEINDAQDTVDQQRKELEDGKKQIPGARKEIAAQRAKLETEEKKIAQQRAQVQEAQSAWAQLDAARAEIAEAEQQLARAKEAALAQAEANARAAAESGFAEADAALDAREAELKAWEAALAAQEEPDASETAALANAWAALEEARAALESEKATAAEAAAAAAASAAEEEFARQEAAFAERVAPELARIEAAEEQLPGKEELADAEDKLNKGEAAIREGRDKLDAAAAELDSLERNYPKYSAQLDYAGAQVAAGRYEYEKNLAKYEKEKADAEQELADAERELLDAEEEYAQAVLDAEDALTLDLYTLDRESNRGYVTFNNDIRIIDALADAFPIFFALVAALVCVTTMTRMVGEERTEIGTLKALGYSAGAIMSKYLLYSGSAAFLGCLGGFLLGSALIPWVVWVAYGIIYDYAKLDFYFSPLMGGLSLAAAVLGTLLVTWLACRLELREKPAELIRPKAPKAGKRILLEHVAPLWRRLGFLAKVSLRNAFRYPLRVLMMLLGIGGCTALLVAGFGAKDSVGHISDYQYGEIFLYDLAVSVDPEEFSSDAAAQALWSGEAEGIMTWQEPVTLTAGEYSKETYAIAASHEGLGGLIRLRDEKNELPFPGPGEAIVTEKIAEVLHLRPGDSFDMRLDDGTACRLRVSGVCKNYLSHYVYFDAASIGAPRYNTALLRVREDADASRLGARLRGEDGVRYVTLTQQERESMEQSMQSIDLILMLVVVCSAALAFITLYNLTNINIMERTREIATVKVLGFTPGETAQYVLRENVLLALLGAALGLFLGKGLHSIIIRALVVENMSCEKRIEPLSFALAFGLTLVFTALTNLVMRAKLEKVNMAESLKSVE